MEISSDLEVIQNNCQTIIATLIEKYQWSFLTLEEIESLVMQNYAQLETEMDTKSIVISTYTAALFHACRSKQDGFRYDDAVIDLRRYLHRSALQRWPDLADDVVDDAVILTLRNIETCRSPEAFLMFGTYKVRQVVTQRFREKKREEKHLIKLPQSDHENLIEQIPNDQDEPRPVETESGKNIQFEREPLLAAIGRLNKREQTTIIRKYYGGESDKQIADFMETTANNVRKIRSVAIKKLREDGELAKVIDQLHPSLS